MTPHERCEELGLRIQSCISKHGFTEREMFNQRFRYRMEQHRKELRKLGASAQEVGRAMVKMAKALHGIPEG